MNTGAFGEGFPYSNFHDLNLDWVIKIAKNFLDQYTHIQNIIQSGETSLTEITESGLAQLEEKATALELVLQQWYNTHSEDIANQLTLALADLQQWYNTHSEDIANVLTQAITDFNSAAELKSSQLLESWPADYSELVEDVNRLNNTIINDFESIALGKIYSKALNGWWATVDGSFNHGTDTYTGYDKIPVTPGEIISFMNIRGSEVYIIKWDKAGTFLGYSSFSVGNPNSYVIPDGVNYIALTITSTANLTEVIAAISVPTELISRLQTGFIEQVEGKNIFNKNDSTIQTKKYIDPTGAINNINDANYKISHLVEVEPNTAYSITVYPGYSSYYTTGAFFTVRFYDKFKNYIGYVLGTEQSGEGYYTVTSLPNAAFMQFNIFSSYNNVMAVKGTSYPATYSAYPEGYRLKGINTDLGYQGILKGKKILYNGDSITESRIGGNADNGGSFPYMIAQITGGTYENRAVGGGTLAVVSGVHNIVSDITNMSSTGNLVCLEGGINDYWNNVPLGTYSESVFDGSLNTSTLCGALESIFRQAINKWVGVPIVFIIIHKVKGTAFTQNTAGYTFAEAREKMIGICNKYSIPYVDIFAEGGLNPYMDSLNSAFMNGGANYRPDGTHPDANGYRKYYVPRLISMFESIMEYDN